MSGDEVFVTIGALVAGPVWWTITLIGPELFWRHTTSGDLRVWTVRGLVVSQAISLTPSSQPDLTWRIVGPR